MKKVLLILGVLVVIAALFGGGTIAYAQGKGKSVNQGNLTCDQWLMGTVMGNTTNDEGGTITLLPRGESATVNIAVNGDTEYKAWLAPRQKVTFADIAYGDWIALCIENNVARVVVLLGVSFHLDLEGNVTAVNGNVVTVHTEDGDLTINLSGGVDGNLTGAVGQPVKLTIGKPETQVLERYLPGLRLGWLIGRGYMGLGPEMKDNGGKLERFRERLEQRLEKWQNKFND